MTCSTHNATRKLHILSLYGIYFLTRKHRNLQRKLKCKPEHILWWFKEHLFQSFKTKYIIHIIHTINLHNPQYTTVMLSLTLNLLSVIFHLLCLFLSLRGRFVRREIIRAMAGLAWFAFRTPPTLFSPSWSVSSHSLCFCRFLLLCLSARPLLYTPSSCSPPPWNQLLGNQLQRLPER